MQQFTASSEVLALLDRVLQTSQSLNAAIAKYVHPVAAVSAPPAPTPPPESLNQPPIVAEPIVLPEPLRPVAPVLTIKLEDLMRESAAYRRRNPSHPPKPPRARPAPRNRVQHQHDLEVLYRRSFRMVS